MTPEEGHVTLFPGLVRVLKQPYLLINTSSPLCKRFKVILLKLTSCAWSHLSLPFCLLSDWGFLYTFIKLIPSLACSEGGVWLNHGSMWCNISVRCELHVSTFFFLSTELFIDVW